MKKSKKSMQAAPHTGETRRLPGAGDHTFRDSLIEKYQVYVKNVVQKMVRAMNLPPGMGEDYISAGYLGLVEAARRYDPKSGVDFKSYSFLRIRGAVIDYIRQSTQVAGKDYRTLKSLQAMQSLREEMESTLCRAQKRDGRLAVVLEYIADAGFIAQLNHVEIEERVYSDGVDRVDPGLRLSNKQKLTEFFEVLDKVGAKESLVIQDYYFRGKSFAEIAAEHKGFSKSWVSRLHNRGIKRLRKLYSAHRRREDLLASKSDN
ncbi:MAG: hypothetical protein DCC49_10985 [Acidobacteria bacterium]|nr:MAG: hypothetical protein DCC49_10985 [Acidobacteriota bacterium]